MSGGGVLEHLGRQFESFLYATLGDDGNGMPVSVLSVLARANLDPWEHAMYLSDLPRRMAIRELAGFLETLPDRLAGDSSSDVISKELIDRLPSKRIRWLHARGPSMSRDGIKPVLHPYRMHIFIGCLVFMLLTQWFFAEGNRSAQSMQRQSAPLLAPVAPSAAPTTAR